MRHITFLLTLMFILAGNAVHTAFAYDMDELPVDDRIKLLEYNKNDIYTITTRVGYQTNIEFGRNEQIQTISVGDRSLWQLIPAGNRLFIRPLENDLKTNMTLLTNKHAYQFDIKSIEGEPVLSTGKKKGVKEENDTKKANYANMLEEVIYVARFVYPERKRPPLPPALPEAAVFAAPAVPVQMTPAYEPPLPQSNYTPMPVTFDHEASRRPVDIETYEVPEFSHETMPAISRDRPIPEPSMRYYDYTFAGSDHVAPYEVFDDGISTYFGYNATLTDLPLVARVSLPYRERPVTPYRKSGYIVVDTVASQFVLRLEGETIYVFNERLGGVR